MQSLNRLIVQAQRAGRHAADLAHDAQGNSASTMGDAHRPGDGTGRLVLAAYRSYGVEEMRAVVRGYQGGYNTRAADLGDYVVRWPQIKAGIGQALPSATTDETRDIPVAL